VALKTYPVAGPDLLEPFWFNKVRHGQHAAVVGPDRTITLEGVPLRLRAEAPDPGTAVRVWLNGSGFFVCATLDEIEREALVRRDAEAADAERNRQRLNALRAEAEAFNARLALPVQWDVGIKDVLSGLTENSWGDGRNKATVEHIYLLEPLQDGRLTRAKGDFLCTSSSGTNGMRYSSVIERSHDGEGKTYQPKVTCKACLALAARWMKEPT
jgi:hypothetical protein